MFTIKMAGESPALRKKSQPLRVISRVVYDELVSRAALASGLFRLTYCPGVDAARLTENISIEPVCRQRCAEMTGLGGSKTSRPSADFAGPVRVESETVAVVRFVVLTPQAFLSADEIGVSSCSRTAR